MGSIYEGPLAFNWNCSWVLYEISSKSGLKADKSLVVTWLEDSALEDLLIPPRLNMALTFVVGKPMDIGFKAAPYNNWTNRRTLLQLFLNSPPRVLTAISTKRKSFWILWCSTGWIPLTRSNDREVGKGDGVAVKSKSNWWKNSTLKLKIESPPCNARILDECLENGKKKKKEFTVTL